MSELPILICCIAWVCVPAPSTAAEFAAATNSVTAEVIARDLGATNVKAAHLLAFSSMVDERPLYVERALVGIEFTDKRWRLVHVYRHPNNTRIENRRWGLAIVNDAPVVPSKEFKKQPTETEVDQFVLRSAWEFQASQGFRLLDGQVFTNAWRKALGHKPKYGYSKPSV